MRRFRFQTKLTIIYLALFLSIQSVLLLAFYDTVTKNVGEQVQDQLAASTRVFKQVIDERIIALGDKAQLLARDDGFRSVIAPALQSELQELVESGTVLSALKNFSQRIKSDLAIIYDLDNTVVAVVPDETKVSRLPVLSDQLKDHAETEGVASTIVAIDGRIYDLVLVPVFAPDLVAWIVLGIEFDQQAAEEIKALSPIELDIAFLYEKDSMLELASTTSSDWIEIESFVRAHITHDTQNLFRRSFSGQDYMFNHIPLIERNDRQGEISALVYFSMDQALAPYYALAFALSGVLAFGLFLLVTGSLVISRSVTRPLRELAGATKRIAAGEYAEVLGSDSGDEISDLTSNFNLMVEAVKERERRIVFQSNHDVETGLPNRNHFETVLKNAAEKNNDFIIAVAEVQQLAALRSVLNHIYVNDLLKAIGGRISHSANVRVARLSTEVFIFILDDISQGDVSASLIANAFLTPFDVKGIAIDVSIKMGFSKFPTDSQDPVKLMQYANSALDEGRTSAQGHAWYVEDKTDDFKHRLSLMSDLREALTSGEVDFAYQPKLDLASDEVSSVEALVRWISPSRGFVSPDDFIPLAERTGDIKLLTTWGLSKAVEQLGVWQAKGINVAIAVNLSAGDLLNRDLPGAIISLLGKHNLAPSSLKLEVTESAVMHDMSRALEVMNMLSAVGLELSIDDYGTGYSSLSYLKKLPVSELKIDKAFVLNLAKSDEDKILVRSTIELAHNLGLKVTAEGVEDQETVDLLREYGCNTLQGYFICKPVPASEIEMFLETKSK